IGFASWSNPTTYYGNDTVKVVKSFQKNNGLVASGIIKDVTLRKIESLKKSKPMKLGQNNAAILNFKNQLVKLGIASWGNPTTYFGTDTKRAVKEFQSYYGLTVDGVMDYRSQSTLKDAVNTTYQKGNSSQDIKRIKNDLVFLDYASWRNPTTYFGSGTVGVVRDFQKRNNLVVNGLIDNITLNKIT